MRHRVVRFYFDYVSPNAYLAWTQLPALAERHGAVIEPVPVLFAGLLEAWSIGSGRSARQDALDVEEHITQGGDPRR
jgi:2-hydroxychromene-2-carboxylate isomerase